MQKSQLLKGFKVVKDLKQMRVDKGVEIIQASNFLKSLDL
jgi:hypothetical protein